jgi:hypothetical protein
VLHQDGEIEMTINIRPRDTQSLCELVHCVTFPCAIEYARMLVPEMRLIAGADGTGVFIGEIWESDGNIHYPASPFDLRVRNGVPEITCPGMFARELLAAWADQVYTEPMLIQLPVR